MNLGNTGGNRITPTVNLSKYSLDKRVICPTSEWSANSIYECSNTEQLIKYYHATLGLHPKRTLAAAAKAGYLLGCPGLTAEAINGHIGVECATEMGHMPQSPSGVRSMTTKKK